MTTLLRARVVVLAMFPLVRLAAAQPDGGGRCMVDLVRAPDDVRPIIERWVRAEPRCNVALEVRVVASDGGLYVFARDERGRFHERLVPDATSAGVLIASWAADDTLEPPARTAAGRGPAVPGALVPGPAGVGAALVPPAVLGTPAMVPASPPPLAAAPTAVGPAPAAGPPIAAALPAAAALSAPALPVAAAAPAPVAAPPTAAWLPATVVAAPAPGAAPPVTAPAALLPAAVVAPPAPATAPAASPPATVVVPPAPAAPPMAAPPATVVAPPAPAAAPPMAATAALPPAAVAGPPTPAAAWPSGAIVAPPTTAAAAWPATVTAPPMAPAAALSPATAAWPPGTVTAPPAAAWPPAAAAAPSMAPAAVPAAAATPMPALAVPAAPAAPPAAATPPAAAPPATATPTAAIAPVAVAPAIALRASEPGAPARWLAISALVGITTFQPRQSSASTSMQGVRADVDLWSSGPLAFGVAAAVMRGVQQSDQAYYASTPLNVLDAMAAVRASFWLGTGRLRLQPAIGAGWLYTRVTDFDGGAANSSAMAIAQAALTLAYRVRPHLALTLGAIATAYSDRAIDATLSRSGDLVALAGSQWGL